MAQCPQMTWSKASRWSSTDVFGVHVSAKIPPPMFMFFAAAGRRRSRACPRRIAHINTVNDVMLSAASNEFLSSSHRVYQSLNVRHAAHFGEYLSHRSPSSLDWTSVVAVLTAS